MLSFAFERLAQLLGHFSRLVRNGAAIDDISQAAGKPGSMRSGDEPNRHG